MNINVLIVDNSAVVRTALTKILNSTEDIDVIAAVRDPIFAMKRMARVKPDVIILDKELPQMDGITFLKKLMEEDPLPIVIFSALIDKKSKTGDKALSLGAVDVITKPKVVNDKNLSEMGQELIDAVRRAASMTSEIGTEKPTTYKNNRLKLKPSVTISPQKSTTTTILPDLRPNNAAASDHIVVIGASMGGVQALESVLSELTVNCPGVVVVQHMPPTFTFAFAERLNSLCSVEVKEGKNGDEIKRGRVIIAPGGKHTVVVVQEGKIIINVVDGPPVRRHQPSIDVLFRSASKYIGEKAMGVIMTGMGDDGANGLKEMKESGSLTLAQSLDSCVVPEMPAVAVRKGAVGRIVPLDEIATNIRLFGTGEKYHSQLSDS